MVSQLVCMGRHTLTGLLTTSGRVSCDWTADYRLYQHQRVDVEKVFESVFRTVTQYGNQDGPVVTALDDSLLMKSGKKIPEVKYARDPMGPPFAVNFVRGQRVVQLSAAVSDDGQAARMIPVFFRSAPSASKPARKAPATQWAQYREQAKQQTLSKHGLACIADARRLLDEAAHRQRPLWVSVDGSYTNRTVLRGLPERVTLIGRIRGDAKLSYAPEVRPSASTGRRRIYGDDAPTPEQLRVDESVPWQMVRAYIAGREHDFKIKTISHLRWRVAGGAHALRLVVIAPLRYRLSNNAPLLYRKPAFLICTDPKAPLQQLLQAYLWRWDIEVNFRDEKTLLGVGQAQVWNNASVRGVPQMMVAAYSLLLAGAVTAYGVNAGHVVLPSPKWQKNKEPPRASTMKLIQALRAELWTQAIRSPRFCHFVKHPNTHTNSTKLETSLRNAVLMAAA